MVIPALALLAVGGTVGEIMTGILAARDAGRIDEQTYQRLKASGEEYLAEMEGLLPPGTVDPMKWEQFKAEVEKFVPEAAEFIPEKTPQQITESGSAEEQQAQKEALRQYRDLAQTGYDPIAAAQQEAALTASAAQASSARQAALREASQRGLGGTGLDVLAGLGATEQAAVGGRQAALQAQAEAGQRRLQALGSYSNLAGQMRQQTTGVESQNVNIMNAFNERAARDLNKYNQYVAEMKNEADLFNLKNQQSRDEALVRQRNEQMVYDTERREAAERERRQARQGLAKDRYKISTGDTQTWSEKEGRKIERTYAPWQKAFGAAGKIGTAGLSGSIEGAAKSYFAQNPSKNPFSMSDDEE